MDNELIKIVSKNGKQLVSGRELHEFLKIGRDFTTWVKNQLDLVESSENIDYIRFPFKVEGNNATLYEYQLTIEIAKEICMIAGIAPRSNEETKKLSKEARKYFIECEKKIKDIQPSLPKTYKEALKELLSQVEENEKLQLENEEMKPKAEFYDTVTESNETFDMSKIAKIINVKGIGRNKLFQILRDKKILCKDNTPYQEYVDRGYFKLVEVTKGAMILHKTVVFQKGLDYIRKLIIQNN